MKVAIITDQHFGARKGNQNLHRHFQRFYERVFFPTLKRESVDAIIDMGDTFDARKGIDFWSLNWTKEHYYNILRDLNIPVHTIIGNHTAFYKDTNDLNSIQLLLREYSNVICYADPTEIKIGSMKSLFVPWINNENREKTMEMINSTDAKVVFGHLELSGFWSNRNYLMEHGDDPSIFQRFKKVFSGHYHHRGQKDNIHYLGNPYEIYWNDVDDPRGFHIIDTETLEVERIDNPHNLFEILYYRDDSPQMFNATSFKDKHVKLIIKEKSSDVKLEQFIDKLYMAGVADLKVMENYNVQESEEFTVEETENTISILNRYVDDCEPDFDMDKGKLKKFLQMSTLCLVNLSNVYSDSWAQNSEGAYAVLDKDGNKVLFFFEEDDDAERYAMMLEADEDVPLRVIEVNFATAVKTCAENGYRYSVITPGDIVIPPRTEE